MRKKIFLLVAVLAILVVLGISSVLGAFHSGNNANKDTDTTTKNTRKTETTAIKSSGVNVTKDTSKSTKKETASANVIDEAKVFEMKCSSCHATGIAPDLSKIGAKYKKDDIKAILINGKQGGMPAGLISGEDSDRLAEWLANKK